MKKIWFKIVCGFLIVILGVYVIFFATKKCRNYEIYSEQQTETKIYTVWHIETFEGGGKSRINILKETARKVEKANPGFLFMISQIDPNALENQFNKETPDIISFGFGVGKIVAEKLVNFVNTFGVRDNLVLSGMFNNKLLAIPFVVSGYALIQHSAENSTFIYGQNKFVNAKNAVNNTLNLATANNQYEAYKQFVNNKNLSLLGTARDVFRVENLNKIGRLNAKITPLGTYTDLIQYIGITNNDEIVNLFIKNLFNINTQNNLTNYSLFGALQNKIYASGIYNEMENAIFNAQIPNVFA